MRPETFFFSFLFLASFWDAQCLETNGNQHNLDQKSGKQKVANDSFRPYIEIWKGKNDVDDGLYTFLMILKHSVFRDGRNDVVVLGGRRKKLINETWVIRVFGKLRWPRIKHNFWHHHDVEPDQDAGSANASVSKSRNEAAKEKFC